MYFRYIKDIGLKINKGELKNRKTEPKVVDEYLISNNKIIPFDYCAYI